MFSYRLYLSVLFMMFFTVAFSQRDSVKHLIPQDSLSKVASPLIRNKGKVDSVLKVHSPKKATIRSAIIPGWGQAYNKKYWKIPIIYGALGTTGAIFFYNLSNYKDFRFAYSAVYAASKPGATAADSVNYFKVKPNLLAIAGPNGSTLRYYRDDFRRNIDYSVLVFIVFWGLNVVDATVDAHLKSFDVSPDLSLKLKIGHSQLANTNGLSLVLAFKK